jgi:type IV pilus assembly protein PilA
LDKEVQMLLKLRQRMASEESGFTLVELLVVMLIIGLLAAIAIPAFFNQRDKAYDANAKEQARTAETAMETYATDNGGVYTGVTAAKLVAIEQSLSDDATSTTRPFLVTANVAATGANDKGWTLAVKSPKTGNVFTIARAEGTSQLTFTCTAGGTAGCPTGGVWAQG